MVTNDENYRLLQDILNSFSKNIPALGQVIDNISKTLPEDQKEKLTRHNVDIDKTKKNIDDLLKNLHEEIQKLPNA